MAETHGAIPRTRHFEGLGIDFERTTDPRLQKLRRAAVIQMFELSELGVVPGQFWLFLDEAQAPGDAVIRFLAVLGLNPDLIRRGDREERARANEVLDLLIDIDGAFSKLSEEVRADVRSAIYCGEYERVRETAQIVRTYLSILELGDRYPDGQRFPAFSEFLQDVASELDNPLAASVSDAETAERIRLVMTDLLRSLSDARVEQEHLIKLLWTDFPEWQAAATQNDITMSLSLFDATLRSVLTRLLVPEEVKVLIERLGELSGELRTLLSQLAGSAAGSRSKRDSGRSHRSSGGSYRKAGPTALDAAFKYFGLRRSRPPSRQQFRAVKRSYLMRTHPDTGGANDAFRECMEHATIVEAYLATA